VDRERRHVAHDFPSELVPDRAHDGDVLVRFEDHRALRELFEGLRERLSERERRAFALCYLAGYTRPQAAPVIGVSPARMEKIMDDVSRKVGSLAELIGGDGWCEARRSLVAAYASCSPARRATDWPTTTYAAAPPARATSGSCAGSDRARDSAASRRDPT